MRKTKPAEPITFAPFSILVQVIHQPDSRFIVLSYPDDPSLDLLSDNLPPLFNSKSAKGKHPKDLEIKGDPDKNRTASNDGENKRLVFEVGEVDGNKRWWFGTWSIEEVKNAAVS
jgi:hypothetical protein